MADISIEELGPGVILEGTNPDKERYRYSIPTWPLVMADRGIEGTNWR